MDRLWTPWRYSYITGANPAARQGVPAALSAWPGPEPGADPACVFCNLIAAVRWGIEHGPGEEASEQAGYILARLETCFLCLNAFPYSSGHVLIVPYRHEASLARLSGAEAAEIMHAAQRVEMALRETYRPDGINLGMNLGEAAGAGVASHLHLHAVPRWFGDTNFMTVAAETRILPETLEMTWSRLRAALR
jgi:ATP adenylyltransferase